MATDRNVLNGSSSTPVAPSSRWTHVWEQEFTGIDALLGQYMHHPVHWALVDRWFDAECPDRIVTDRVYHSFCTMSETIIDSHRSAPVS